MVKEFFGHYFVFLMAKRTTFSPRLLSSLSNANSFYQFPLNTLYSTIQVCKNTSLVVPEALAHHCNAAPLYRCNAAPHTTSHHLQHLTACLIQYDRRGLEIGKHSVIGASDQLLLNKFSDSIIPWVRTSKIENGCYWAPKWPTRSGKVSNHRFLDAPINFRKTGFLIRALLPWEK